LAGIEVQANNPIGLTVAGPGYGNPSAILYPGQTGGLTSALGYTFATFQNMGAGIAAGASYLSQRANETIGQLLAQSFPGDQAYVESQGFDPNATVGSVNVGSLEAAIAGAEGTLSAAGGTAAFANPSSGLSPAPAGPGGFSSDDPLNVLCQLTGICDNSTAPQPGAGVTAAPGPNQAGSGASSSDPLGLGNILGSAETWLASIGGPVVFVVVGVVFLLGALLIFAKTSGESVVDVVTGRA
jgi:hypothetical protein